MLSGPIEDGYSPEANKGHLMAAVELDSRGSHDGECVLLDGDWLESEY